MLDQKESIGQIHKVELLKITLSEYNTIKLEIIMNGYMDVRKILYTSLFNTKQYQEKL